MSIGRIGLVIAAAMAVSLSAQAQAPGQKDADAGERVKDAALQPVEDVNLKKDKIPPELEKILDDPYSTAGLRRCRDIGNAIAELDAVLGPDFDVVVEEDKGKKRRDTVIRLSGNFLSNLILPFRGIVREVTGSAEAKRDFEAAIVTGVARRSFLKGVGVTRGCKPPAAPALDT